MGGQEGLRVCSEAADLGAHHLAQKGCRRHLGVFALLLLLAHALLAA